MQIKEYSKNPKIHELLKKWDEENRSRISTFKMKEYEDIFAHIYSFEFVLIQIDEIISECENSRKVEPETVKFNGKEFKLTVEEEKVEIFTNKWKNLNDIGLNSTERKELNIQYEDYLKLKYARYMGFIEGVLRMFNVHYEKKRIGFGAPKKENSSAASD